MHIMRIVIRVILAIILSVIVLIALAYVLLIGGCAALLIASAPPVLIKNGQDSIALEQAKHAPLPPHVQRLIEDEYLGYNAKDDSLYGPIVSDEAGLPQDPSGRYMLTIEGLYDFASAKLTRLDCPGLQPTGGPRINFRRLWFDEQLFLWGRCVYDITTLQPGPIEDVFCDADGCRSDEFTDKVAPLARQADQVYKTTLQYLFVKRPSGAPARVWVVYNLLDSTVQGNELGHSPNQLHEYKGRAAYFGQHSVSPNGEYDASFDSTALTIKRKQNGQLVAQVNFKDSNARSAIFGHAESILGWTGDSRQVVFLVEGDFGYYKSLAQVLTLTIP